MIKTSCLTRSYLRSLLILCFLLGGFSLGFAETKVIALGDSITEGFGVEKAEAYPYLLQQILMQKGYTEVKVINAGLSGSTTASAASRLKWYLQIRPQIMILALGANDGLRGLNVKQMKKNLATTIKIAQQKNILVLLAGMKMPPNYGIEYTKSFHQVYVDLSKEYQLPFIPFLLEGVGGRLKFNQADGIHPNEEGHRLIAQNIAKVLIPLLTQP